MHATDQLSVRVEDLEVIAAAMASLRARPPEALGGDEVVEAADLAEGWAGLPPTDGLLYRTAGGSRVVVRPSGTEPKLKCYLEAVVPVSGEDLAAGHGAEAGRRLTAVKADLYARLDVHG